jgi:hypothetical protein
MSWLWRLYRLLHTTLSFHDVDDDNDFLYGFDGVLNNDNLDGGEDPDIC